MGNETIKGGSQGGTQQRPQSTQQGNDTPSTGQQDAANRRDSAQQGSKGSTTEKKPSNFANDPDRASEAGKKGGQS